MNTDQTLAALIIAAAVVFVSSQGWRTWRGKTSCNCGCCKEKPLAKTKPSQH
ncbi:MAG: hypothetical protein LBV28_01210 [Puniceicoccales bacterium]|nr:hypothetical protein [Puniceicoccales bacterium]